MSIWWLIIDLGFIFAGFCLGIGVTWKYIKERDVVIAFQAERIKVQNSNMKILKETIAIQKGLRATLEKRLNDTKNN